MTREPEEIQASPDSLARLDAPDLLESLELGLPKSDPQEDPVPLDDLGLRASPDPPEDPETMENLANRGLPASPAALASPDKMDSPELLVPTETTAPQGLATTAPLPGFRLATSSCNKEYCNGYDITGTINYK